MLFRWADFLPVAQTLRQAGDPASFRASVSRSYYAVFGEALTFSEAELGKSFENGSVHKAVSDYFDLSPDSARKVFGSNLRQLKSQRVTADYFAERPVGAKEADQALADATRLLEDLAKIRSDSKA